MRILISGGTGFLGHPLATALAAAGHDVIVLSRHGAAGASPPAPGRVTRVAWTPDGRTGEWASAVSGAGAVVNLAGESIAAGRWTAARKEAIRTSRVLATRSLVAAIREASPRPPVLVSGSAIGIYGDRGDELLTETSAPGSDFLAQVALEWEREAQAASALGVRVALLRTGIVLEADGGALQKMAIPFKLFAGGPVGSGRQYMSWIHRDDWVGLARWTIDRPELTGPVNLTAPAPVTNAEFSRALGAALHRPAFMPAPAFAMRIALGEMADALLLASQRVLPACAQEHGYRFQHAQLDEALRAIYR